MRRVIIIFIALSLFSGFAQMGNESYKSAQAAFFSVSISFFTILMAYSASIYAARLPFTAAKKLLFILITSFFAAGAIGLLYHYSVVLDEPYVEFINGLEGDTAFVAPIRVSELIGICIFFIYIVTGISFWAIFKDQ